MLEFLVPQYHTHDFLLRSGAEHSKPFDVDVRGTFVHESGATIENVPGFYDGDRRWIVRFSPTREGRWTGTTVSADPEMDGISLGDVPCVKNENRSNHGRIGIDPSYPRRFAFEDGTPFVPIGFECDWLFALHQSEPHAFSELVSLIAERGFNYVVTNVYAHTGFSEPGQEFVYGPPKMYAFGGTNDAPDHSVLNVGFFRDFDAVFRALQEKGIILHLMIQVQNKRVNWPPRYSDDDDRFWRYVVARYQAFGNVIWDIGKESYNFRRELGSPDYVLNRIRLIRQTDAYGHLVTVHDPVGNSAATNAPEDVASDFVSDQIHLADTTLYNRETIRRFRSQSKPYMNIEYGYELGVEPIKTYHSGTTRRWEDVLIWTYAILLGGGYPCYYYSNTSWDLIKFEPEPPGWIRYRYLADFLSNVNINPMIPDNEYVNRGFCLTDAGKEYLIFLPDGGNVSPDLTAIPASSTIRALWMDCFTGERVEADVDGRRFVTPLENPLSEKAHPCVLWITLLLPSG